MLETNLAGYKLRARGKVRDIYEDADRLLIVATDRISAFDYILATGIPDKGRVLTKMTLFWLDFLRDVVPNHLISTDVRESRIEELTTSTTEALGNTQDANYAQVATEYTSDQVAYEAALKAGGSIVQMSLLEFLK